MHSPSLVWYDISAVMQHLFTRTSSIAIAKITKIGLGEDARWLLYMLSLPAHM